MYEASQRDRGRFQRRRARLGQSGVRVRLHQPNLRAAEAVRKPVRGARRQRRRGDHRACGRTASGLRLSLRALDRGVRQRCPQPDGVYAEIEANARVRCEQLATDAGQDPSACQTAVLNRPSSKKTLETYKECTQLVGQIDENKDGDCPAPEGAWVPGETGGNGESGSESDGGETSGGGIVLRDLGFEPAP